MSDEYKERLRKKIKQDEEEQEKDDRELEKLIKELELDGLKSRKEKA